MFNKSTQYLLAIMALTLVLADCQVSRPCNVAFRCSDTEDVVWATDGSTCFVWRNACHLANENCNRQNRHEPVLQVVTKEECQKLCTEDCTLVFRPVCAEYNGQRRTFSNICVLRRHICQTGETYTFIKDGEC